MYVLRLWGHYSCKQAHCAQTTVVKQVKLQDHFQSSHKQSNMFMEGNPDVSYGAFSQFELLISRFTLLEAVDNCGSG